MTYLGDKGVKGVKALKTGRFKAGLPAGAAGKCEDER